MRRLLPLLLAGLLAQGCAQPEGAADAAGDVRLLTAERIHTSDPSRPLAEAMAWDGEGRILAIGSVEDVGSAWPGAERIDLGDATVVPGMIDSHGHLMSLGFSWIITPARGSTHASRRSPRRCWNCAARACATRTCAGADDRALSSSGHKSVV